ncbi:recombinase family protein, partial [Alkalibaculum bacchi]|uniref:recombinase family protein n=1 Tax=Alkalibaculum bacchi TaxID=645887 RepID=UPI00350E42BC
KKEVLRVAAYCRVSTAYEENNGELPMYLMENNHETIISKEIFQEAQRRKSS